MIPRKKKDADRRDQGTVPDVQERRRRVERDADRGSHGMTGGTERPAGHELER